MIKPYKSNFSAAKEFTELGIRERNLGRRESASGPGSSVANTDEIHKLIFDTVNKYNVSSILDLGCGDWAWMSILIRNIRKERVLRYIGWDASTKLIDELRESYGDNETTFECKDITLEPYPKVDLIICRDVLFHLSPENISIVLNKVKASHANLFISTSYDSNNAANNIENNNNIENWFFHTVNIDLPPYGMDKFKIHSIKELRNSHKNINRYVTLYNIESEKRMIENLFLSVGAMKAGTTWLYEKLKDNPDIHFSEEKEIHFFANKVGIENQLSHKNRIEKLKLVLNKYNKGNLKYIAENANEIAWYAEYARPTEISKEWYENLFRFNSGEKYFADFSNLYCQMDHKGWELVRQTANNIKVVYTLRDPLSRLWSHYKFHMKWVNREDEALDAGFAHFKELLAKPWFWINAEYSKNISRLKENLDESELLILYFEDFRADPFTELAKVEDFLEVSRTSLDQEKIDQKVNKTKDFGIPTEWMEYMIEKLRPLELEMKENKIWHDNWTSVNG